MVVNRRDGRLNVLYIMHVDWDWIQQRPHYLARELARYCKIQVLYPITHQRRHLVVNDRAGLPLRGYTWLRGSSDLAWVNSLSKRLLRGAIRGIMHQQRPDVIWVTHPSLVDVIPDDIKMVVYDCMDDALAFGGDIEILRLQEVKLINRASVVFVSSKSLAGKLAARVPGLTNVMLVRNAFDLNEIQDLEVGVQTPHKPIRIGYIGTVSSWFDGELLLDTLHEFPNIEYHVIGPIGIDIRRFTCPRIIFHGPTNHTALRSLVSGYDCLIMPFTLSPLIESVDPVKLYEYISWNKPVISVEYDEIAWLRPYLWLYRDKNDLKQILACLIRSGFPKKYSQLDWERFVSANSWQQRGIAVMQTLQGVKAIGH